MRIVEQTLLEQLKITDREIEKRMALFDLSETEVSILRSCRGAIADRLDWAIDEFYARQIDDPEIALIIGDAETLSRLKNAMRNYIVELFSGVYDDAYVNSRLRVGKIHWRIGVTPKYFLSALRRLYDVLCAIVEEAAETQAEYVNQKQAILKILFFDSQLVFDTYINALSSEVLAAKKETVEYADSLELEVAKRTKQLEELALTDELTGVHNKRAFYEHARREMAAAKRTPHEISMLYVDVNGFKQLNDTLGHQAGDELLCLITKNLGAAARSTDIICRLGGDEFCVLMPRAGYAAAAEVARRFADLMAANAGGAIGASVGISSTGPSDHCTVDELVLAADQSMYRAKHRSELGPAGAILIDTLQKLAGVPGPAPDGTQEECGNDTRQEVSPRRTG